MKRLTTQELIARDMPEAELQDNVIGLAEALGYTAVHVRDARHQKLEGSPDVVLGGRNRIITIEFKREQPQELWRDLILAAGHEWYLVRPSDWLNGTVERILREKP